MQYPDVAEAVGSIRWPGGSYWGLLSWSQLARPQFLSPVNLMTLAQQQFSVPSPGHLALQVSPALQLSPTIDAGGLLSWLENFKDKQRYAS